MCDMSDLNVNCFNRAHSQHTQTHQAAQRYLSVELYFYIPQYQHRVAGESEIGDYRDDYSDVSKSGSQLECRKEERW